MTEEIKQYVRDMDAKYRRVVLSDAIPIESDSNDFYNDVVGTICKRPRGKYEVLCVYYPDPLDFVDEDAEDQLSEILTDLTSVDGVTYGWAIPKGDEKYADQYLALVFSSQE
jgi:hypothetical protein